MELKASEKMLVGPLSPSRRVAKLNAKSRRKPPALEYTLTRPSVMDCEPDTPATYIGELLSVGSKAMSITCIAMVPKSAIASPVAGSSCEMRLLVAWIAMRLPVGVKAIATYSAVEGAPNGVDCWHNI